MSEWIVAERRAAAALAVVGIRTRFREPCRRAQKLLVELLEDGSLGADCRSSVQSALAELDTFWRALAEQEAAILEDSNIERALV